MCKRLVQRSSAPLHERRSTHRAISIVQAIWIGLRMPAATLGSALLAWAPLQGHAAEAASTDSGAPSTGLLQEVVVTAQKRQENLQEVPIAVSVVSGARLSNSSIDTQLSLPQITPNLQYNNSANFVAPFIRGVGTTYANPGLDPSIGIYLDDVYYPRASSGLFDMNDVSRIEILKGPQGTLYGRNTTGGAIRILTEDPTADDSVTGALTFGRYNKVRAEAAVNGGIAPNLAGRLAVDYNRDDGYVKNVNPGFPNVMDNNQVMVHGKLLWTPTDRLTLKASFLIAEKQDHEGVAFLPLLAAPLQVGLAAGGNGGNGFYSFGGTVPEGPGQRSHQKARVGSIRIDYAFESFTLSSITSYVLATQLGYADLDATSLPILHGLTVAERTADYTEELQAVSTGTGPFKWVGGVYALREQGGDNFGVWGTATGGAFVGGTGRVNTTSIAPYGQLSYDFTDAWQATLGGRYTIEHKTLLGNQFYITTPGVNAYPVGIDGLYVRDPSIAAAPDLGRAYLKFSEFAPKVSVSYKPSAQNLLYATFSKGFKSGGFNLPDPAPGSPDQVKPEEIEAYEIGWKTEAGNVRFNSDLFYYKQKNLQVQILNPTTNAVVVVNAAQSQIYGVEVDSEWRVNSFVSLNAGAGYLHTKFNDYIGAAYIPSPSGVGLTTEPQSFSGNQLPEAPTVTAYLQPQLKLPIDPRFGNLTVYGVVNWQDKYYYDSQNSLFEPSRFLINASIRWQAPNEHYTVTAYGTNLSQTQYHTAKGYTALGGYQIPAAPCQFGIKFGVAF